MCRKPISLCLIGSFVFSYLGAHLALHAEEETRLLSVPNMKEWKPPMKEEKVWTDRPVVESLVWRDGERDVNIEKCATELVAKEEAITTESVEGQTSDELVENYSPVILTKISASIYKEEDKILSKVRVTCGGDVFDAWINIDFNHFRGVINYVANGREYYQTGGFGDMDGITASAAGCPVSDSKLNAYKVGFVPAGNSMEDETNLAYIALIDMITLYEKERDLLEKAYAIRLSNREKAKVWREANPPTPEDIKIRFWKKEIVEPETGSN